MSKHDDDNDLRISVAKFCHQDLRTFSGFFLTLKLHFLPLARPTGQWIIKLISLFVYKLSYKLKVLV